MASRRAHKQKPQSARAKLAAGTATAQARQAETDWQQECVRLRAELEVARAEIAELRSRQEQVLNRIDWVIDSLDSLSDNDA